MKKVLAMLFLALSVSASFAQTTSNVVRWKTIVGNITVSNNDAVAGINPGTTPWSTTGLEHDRRKGSRQSFDRTCFLRGRRPRVEWWECHRHSGRRGSS